MTDPTPSISQELEDLRNRLTWLDEERRKAGKRTADLEQRVDAQARSIEQRDTRIQKLEEQLAGARTRLQSVGDVNIQFDQMRKELIGMIDKVDERRKESLHEGERLRNTERQITNRELNEIRKALPSVTRLTEDMAQRKAEESRLQQQISTIRTTFTQYDNRIDAISSGSSYSEEIGKQLQRQVSKVEAAQLELGKRIEENRERLSSFNLSVGRMEASVQESSRQQSDGEQKIREWLEQARTADYDRSQRVAGWQAEFEAFKQDMATFNQQFLRIHDQSNGTRAALQQLETWRKQIEIQQRELSEISRINTQRFAEEWEAFRAENEKFWATVNVDSEQRQNATDRRVQTLEAQLHDISEYLANVKAENDTLYRIQSAQQDALKRFPLLWMEEVEKAIANDPNRRRSAASAPIPDEL